MENLVRADVFALVNRSPDCRIFRNNVGMGFSGKLLSESPTQVVLQNPRRVRYGLRPGSADLIGWQSVEITPAMVGKQFARFLSIETKSACGYARDEQKNWRDRVLLAGGLALITRCVEDVEKMLWGGV